jgi:hypothetical protein
MLTFWAQIKVLLWAELTVTLLVRSVSFLSSAEVGDQCSHFQPPGAPRLKRAR